MQEIQDYSDLVFFTASVVYIRPEILEAGKTNLPYRSEAMRQRINLIIKNLKTIAEVDDNYEVLLFPGTGSNVMEASVRSLVRDGEKVLSVSVGPFGDIY